MFAVFITACSDEKPLPIDPPPGPPEMAERTVLAYQIVDDSRIPELLRSDFYEMVEGMKSVDDQNNNLLVFSYLTNDLPYLIYLQKNSVGEVIADTVKVFPDQNPLEKEFMTDVIDYVIDKYPAKDYGLVLESHGQGWLAASPSANSRWFGLHHNTNMNIGDLKNVLERFPRFNFLLFDACYMQAIEVAYELRNCADYIISSPSEIPGPGGAYQKIIPYMFESDEPAINIAKGYFEYYKNYQGLYFEENRQQSWIYGVSISVIKTSELKALADITKGILSERMSGRKVISLSSLFYYDIGRYYYDFDGLMKLITGEDNKYEEWRFAFNKAQIYFQTTATNYVGFNSAFDMTRANGISMYVPTSSIGNPITFYRSLAWYTDGGWQAAGW